MTISSSDELVTYRLDGNVAVLGINRPSKRNAMNDSAIIAIRNAVFRATEEARCGVIFGHGDNFSAGLDLAEAASWMGSEEEKARRRRRRNRWHRTFDLISRGPIPWVAALHGATIGGGLELAAAAHLRVADETTFFALPEGQRGIFVGGGGTVRIQRLMGYARMTDLMLTGRTLTAQEGERANLCQYVVSKGEALDRAISLATRISENTLNTNWAICNGLPRINDMSHDDGLFFETLISGSVYSSETKERLSAFLEKRAARLVEPGKSGDEG